MKIEKVVEYLETELPEFTYTLGKDTPHEENWNSILINRDGNQLILDVSKVENKRGLENLKAYIKSLWDKVES